MSGLTEAAIAYQDERATLLQGESWRVLMQQPDDSADLVLADPPYSSGGQFRGDRVQATGTKYMSSDSSRQAIADFSGDNRDQRSFTTWAAMWLGESHRILKPGRACVVFTDWRQMPAVTDALQAGGFVWRGILTWDKVGGRPGPGIANGRTEFAVWGTKGPIDLGTECYLAGIQRHAIQRDERDLHQTPKPISLLAELCKLAPAGGLVVDPFAGSGSVAVAALKTGRRSLSIEMSPVHAATAAGRLERHAAQADLFEVVA